MNERRVRTARPYTERRVHCDLLCQFASHLTMRTGRSNAAQHPGRKCLFRGKITPCERNFTGECAASQKNAQGPDCERRPSLLRFPQPGIWFPVRRRQRHTPTQFQARAPNISVHAGDDRLLLHRTIEKIRRVCFWFLRAAQPLEFLPRPGLSGSDVSSSRERTAVASENGDTRR
jgi:hypothetical protein